MLNFVIHVFYQHQILSMVPGLHRSSYNTGPNTNSGKYYNGLIQNCKMNKEELYMLSVLTCFLITISNNSAGRTLGRCG